MARYFRRGNWGINPYRRYKSSYRKRAKGNYKSAKSQSDQITCTLNIPTKITTFHKQINAGTQEKPDYINSGTYALNIFDLLRKSTFYQSYASMYDEMKIDKINIKLTPSSFLISNTQNYHAITVYTAWDRSGLSSEQLRVVTTNLGKLDTTLGTISNSDGVYCTISREITSYSSAISKSLNPNSNTAIRRALYPKTIQEKGQWVSTSSIKEWYTDYDKNKGRYYGIPITDYLDGGDIGRISINGYDNNNWSSFLLEKSPIRSSNPCSLIEDSGLKFKPVLLIGVYPDSEMDLPPNTANNEITSNPVTFNLEADIVVSFRGLRKVGIV